METYDIKRLKELGIFTFTILVVGLKYKQQHQGCCYVWLAGIYNHCLLPLLATTQETRLISQPGSSLMGRLAVSYFHMGIHTIIGARSFHGPVRDGKAWDQPAMAARH